MDGHTAVKNNEVKRVTKGSFTLILAALEDTSNVVNFIIHATSNTSYSSVLNPLQFLLDIGFNQFRGTCPLAANDCVWKTIAIVHQQRGAFLDHNEVHAAHQRFDSFVEKVEQLYETYKSMLKDLKVIGCKLPDYCRLPEAIPVEIIESEVPGWVESLKFDELRQLEQEIRDLEEKRKPYLLYLPLLYGTGDLLQKSVLKTLQKIGIEAYPTDPGFPVDILAESNGAHFAFEVTGVDSLVKKEKVTQIFDFNMAKENSEKIILIANTYRQLPMEDRQGKENFTEPVIDNLTKLDVLLMTSWDLYQILSDFLLGNIAKDQVIKIFSENIGVYTHKAELTATQS